MGLLPLADKAVLSNPFQDGPGVAAPVIGPAFMADQMPKIPVAVPQPRSSIISLFPAPSLSFLCSSYRWKHVRLPAIPAVPADVVAIVTS